MRSARTYVHIACSAARGVVIGVAICGCYTVINAVDRTAAIVFIYIAASTVSVTYTAVSASGRDGISRKVASVLHKMPVRRLAGDADEGHRSLHDAITTTVARRALPAVARLMPAAAGRRWLAETESFLFEAAPEQCAKASRNYLITTPQVITGAWASYLARRAQLVISGRTSAGHRDGTSH